MKTISLIAVSLLFGFSAAFAGSNCGAKKEAKKDCATSCDSEKKKDCDSGKKKEGCDKSSEQKPDEQPKQ